MSRKDHFRATDNLLAEHEFVGAQELSPLEARY